MITFARLRKDWLQPFFDFGNNPITLTGSGLTPRGPFSRSVSVQSLDGSAGAGGSALAPFLFADAYHCNADHGWPNHAWQLRREKTPRNRTN